MGCWVVPAVAAEIWAVPLARVLEAIADGSLPHRIDAGFTLIDAHPHGMHLSMPKASELRPPTYRALTLEERAALNAAPAPELPQRDADDEAADFDGDWMTTRRAVSRQRRRPLAA